MVVIQKKKLISISGKRVEKAVIMINHHLSVHIFQIGIPFAEFSLIGSVFKVCSVFLFVYASLVSYASFVSH